MKKYLSQKSARLGISKLFLVAALIFIWIFSGWLQIRQYPLTSLAFAAMRGPSRSPSGFHVSSPVVFSLSVNDISEICGSSLDLPAAKYWWVFVNSLTETGGSCGGGSFCSETFDSNILSVTAHIPLPPRSDYYVAGTFCSDSTNDPTDPNGNFWSPNTALPLEGSYDAPFNPIFNIKNAE